MSVRVEGLKELRRDLRKLAEDETWKPALREAGRRAAGVAVDEAKSIASGTRAGHEAIETIRALAGQTKAQIAGGTARVVWFAGWNFGSSRYKQFPPKAKPDYFLFESVERKREEIVRVYADAIDQLVGQYF